MSDMETAKSDTNQDEAAKPDQPNTAANVISSDTENVVAPVVEEQTAIPQTIEPKVAQDTINETADTTPQKEVNISEIRNGDVPTNGVTTECETPATETAKKTKDDAVTTSECKQNEEPSKVAELQEPSSIGAGDICSETNLQKDTNTAQKPDVEIGDQAPVPKDKSLADNNSKTGSDELTVSNLKDEVKKAIVERDTYRKKLEITEKKLAALQASYDALLKGEGDEVLLRRMVDQLKAKLIQTSLQLEDRIRVVCNQEKQISALNSQVASLKEVETLTRSLLQIRNLEVKQLQKEVEDMEGQISEERGRYTTIINKLDNAVKLNADLKEEYETQLGLFRDLREKYEEKVTLLSEEKRALENSVQAVPK